LKKFQQKFVQNLLHVLRVCVHKSRSMDSLLLSKT
jgi:hypothetical protein